MRSGERGRTWRKTETKTKRKETRKGIKPDPDTDQFMFHKLIASLIETIYRLKPKVYFVFYAYAILSPEIVCAYCTLAT